MRFHIPAYPHTDLTPEYDWCAYTAKVRRFARMMTARGHTVYTYGGPTADTTPGHTHITVVTPNDRARWFPHWNPETDVWAHPTVDVWDASAPWWTEMNTRTVKLIAEHAQPRDILGIIAGTSQRQIADAYPNMTPVEWGIGYAGVFAAYRVFESYAWMHHLAAREPTDNIRWYDTVIPNSFDAADFTPLYEAGDYLLYMGRMTERKGMAVLRELAHRTDLPLVTAGQDTVRIDGAEHVGVITGPAKAALLAGAYATVVPSTYLEPFGGVAVESMLSGTPVITTDYGAFTETVAEGVSGFRCRTMAEFHDAIDRTTDLSRMIVRAHAERYLCSNVAAEYERYFERVASLWTTNWDGTPV